MARTLRIVTGLVMFTFVTLHLLNLALVNISIDVAEQLRPIMMWPFSNPIGKLLLPAAFVVHMVLGFHSLYWRGSLRLTPHDLVQLLTALAIFPLLVPHVLGVMADSRLLDLPANYRDQLSFFWMHSPPDGLRQILAVIVVWVHGCLGLLTWLQLKTWWDRFSAIGNPLIVAVPVLALFGFVAGGHEILNKNEQSPQTSNLSQSAPSVEQLETRAFIRTVKIRLLWSYFLLLAVVILMRYLRLRANRDLVEVVYADGRSVKTRVGPTLLEIARLDDVPHANLCRGKGRCGTCCVQILSSDSALNALSAIEQATLNRTNAPSEARLACQLKPGPGVITIKQLLAAGTRMQHPEQLISVASIAGDVPEITQENKRQPG